MKTQNQISAWAWLLATALTLAAGCSKAKIQNAPAQPVRVAVVENTPAVSNTAYSATILPEAQVDLSFRLGGYVQLIHKIKDATGHLRDLEEGDYVDAGTVLAALRPFDYQTRVDLSEGQLAAATSARDTAKAQLDEANAACEQAHLHFERSRVLFEKQALVKQDYDDARSGFDRAQARVAAAEAQLNAQKAHIREVTAQKAEAGRALADSQLRAPFSGVVVSRKVEVGSLATPGAPAFVLADIHRVKVVFGVPDLTLASFHPGQSLPVTTEALPGTVFHGFISSISASADSSNRVFAVEVAVPNPKQALKIGMIAAIQKSIQPNSDPVPMVPISAVVRRASMDSYGVFVLENHEGSTRAQLRPVQLGQIDGNRIVISDGLKLGDRIVADGGLQLSNGQTVREIQ